mmetsp:Transcript_6286/g.15068  ORF Transcript_6286/g.15068 Transcript_6286/m.15068 type:complete len:832 (+) Transcript_6286:44-2539(+)
MGNKLVCGSQGFELGHHALNDILADKSILINPSHGGEKTFKFAPVMAENPLSREALQGLTAASAKSGEEVLLSAAICGEVAAVASALAANVDVNVVDTTESYRAYHGATPLLHACKNGHKDVVAMLLAHPECDLKATTLDLDNNSRRGQTPLIWAAREGHASVGSLLVDDERCDVNAATAGSFTAFMIATQGGHIDMMRLLMPRVDPTYTPMKSTRYPGQPGANAMAFAILEGHAEAVRTLLEEGGVDPEIARVTPAGRMTPLAFAVIKDQTQCMAPLLQAKANPNTLIEGTKESSLDVAHRNDLTEAVLRMMLHGGDTSKVLSPIKRAQLMGNLSELVHLASTEELPSEEEMPRLHRAILRGQKDDVHAEIAHFAKPWSAMYVVDGAHMPALFYAIELARMDVLHMVLARVHCFPAGLVPSLCDTILQASTADVGQRTFQVIMLLIASSSVQDGSCCEGLLALLLPWLGSLTAVRFFEANPQEFDRLRDLCCTQREKICLQRDSEVAKTTLEQLARVGTDLGVGGGPPLRQDMPGLLPTFKYFWKESDKRTMGGDHERYLAGSLALLGTALEATFAHDMLELFAPVPGTTLHTAPAKSFIRMVDKLRNPSDHGDRALPKPRPAMNVDVLRFSLEVNSPLAMQKAFDMLKNRFRILRTKNNYGSADVPEGCRCLVVHFAYEAKVTFKQLFGDTLLHWPCEKWTMQDSAGKAWFKYVSGLAPQEDWRIALQGLCHAARTQQDAEIVLAAEVQLVYAPYLCERRLSDLLFKIHRCETGPCEMLRSCASTLKPRDEKSDRCLRAVKALAVSKKRSGAISKPIPFTLSFTLARGG